MASNPLIAANAEHSVFVERNFAVGDRLAERLERYVPPKKAATVTFQSVPAGTTVPRGTTINVRLVSDTDVIVAEVLDKELPLFMRKYNLEDIDEILGGDDELIKRLKDSEDPREDIALGRELEAKVKKAKGTSIPEAELGQTVEAFHLLLQ